MFWEIFSRARLAGQSRVAGFSRNISRELDVIGKRSDDLYIEKLADVYMSRDREVLRTGIPIINRLYAYVADRSTHLNIVSVFPLRSVGNVIIGTACIYHRASSAESVPDWYSKIAEAITYANVHYAQNIAVADLAKVAHLSVSQFGRIFSEVMEMSPGRYILIVRINAACRLLETTNQVITDIAVKVGFWDHSHFIKAFKRFRGITPRQYRKQHWKM